MYDDEQRTHSFGEWLRRQRQARGWKQKELAARVGCALGTIKKIETDERQPSIELAERIATILGIPAEKRAAIVQAARGVQAVDRLPLPALAVNTPLPWEHALAQDSAATVVPQCHQLRTPLPDFVGQQAAITTLLAALRQAAGGGAVAAISGVQGMGGIGKTELAILVANRLIDTFPDAQIIVNLQGTSATPLTAAQALQAVIHAFKPNAQLPDDLAALKSLYCTMLHGQRALILADDARDAAQVRALIPPSGSALLITSRMRFTLPGMAPVHLEQLAESESVVLLHGICPRLAPVDALVIARACGHLPLALRVCGSMLSNNVSLSIADYLTRLVDEQQRLAQLRDPDDPQLNVEASLELSYALLDVAAQQVFRQLGVFVADFTRQMALAVVESPPEVDAAHLLGLLLRRNLVMYDEQRGRWRLHDLVRDLARRHLAVTEFEATMWRYAQAAVRIAQETQDQDLAGSAARPAALVRFDTERPHLDAARRWATEHAAMPAADALLVADAEITDRIGLLRYDQRHERLPQLVAALAAARRLGDRSREGQILMSLGIVHYYLGASHQARPVYEEALALFRELGDRHGEGRALNSLGDTYHRSWESQRAITAYTQALAIRRAVGDRSGEGFSLGNLGGTYIDLGRPREASACYEQALAIKRALGDRYGEAAMLERLGLAYAQLGNSHQAVPAYAQAIAIFGELGDRYGEGFSLGNLGDSYMDQGRPREASTCYGQAMAIKRALGDRYGEAAMLERLGLAYAQLGNSHQAIPAIEEALATMRTLRDRRAEAHVLEHLARAYLAIGEVPRAIDRCAQALVIAREVDTPALMGAVLSTLGCAYAAGGQIARASAAFVQALAIFREVGDRRSTAQCSWHYGLLLARKGDRERALPLLRESIAYQQEIGHAAAAEHAALLAGFEARAGQVEHPAKRET